MFAKTIPHLVGQETELEDSSGLRWPVTLSDYNGFLAFHKGWRKFSVDHGLKVGEFLLFHHFKKGHFVVQIFESSCGERTDFSKSSLPLKQAKITEKIAPKATPSQRNVINPINFDKYGQLHKRVRHSRNLVQASTSLDMGAGDSQTTETSATNQEWSSTSIPIASNLENYLNQPSTRSDTLKPEGGNKQRPCLDNAFCVIIDRDACCGESEKGTGFYDLSVFEVHQSECIAGKSKLAINGEETISIHAQTNVKSRAEAELRESNNAGTASIGSMTASKVGTIGMIENIKHFSDMDNVALECEKVLSDGFSSEFLRSTSVKLADNGRTGDNTSNACKPYQNAERNNDNCMGADEAIKALKKEHVEWTEQASDLAQKSLDTGLKPTTAKEDDGSSTSRFKRKALEMELDDSLDESASIPASISCLAATNDHDFIELPASLPAITFRKGRGEKKCAVLLKDPEGRRWPAIYYERFGLFVLICGWKRFNEENRTRPGDRYVFSVEDEDQCKYKVDVVRM